MDEKEPQYVVCRNGVFILPETIVRSLAAHARGLVYTREDDDVLTISASQLTGGHRRPLTARFRALMFRQATQLAIVDLNDSLRIMGVNWRKG
jgi:hypothetical protein